MAIARLALHCRGTVQGVGFRPFVHRLASALTLDGVVENVAGSVRIELQGERAALQQFLRRLVAELPPPARLEPLRPHWLPPLPQRPAGVRIAAAAPIPLGVGLVAPALSADRAPCAACRAELADPTSRRFRDPFISCSQCGPRYSIATAEPYARSHTTLAGFPLCPACQREFDDPADRRFHAETTGCPLCGPRLALLDAAGAPLIDGGSEALIRWACALLHAGGVLALQGVGGFQLLVDATNPEAVALLRRRKARPFKPLALLVADADAVVPWVRVDAAERQLLENPAAPIVLLRRRDLAEEAFPGVAPASAALGVMLPASPLHQLLAQAAGRPLVATSGNRSGELLCTDPLEAIERLGSRSGAKPIADAFLVHNRPIARPLDDSVAQVVAGRPMLLRRARGYAPEPLRLPVPPPPGRRLLAVGADLNSAPALLAQGKLWLAPYGGDLAGLAQQQRLAAGLAELSQRHGEQLEAIGSDRHPGYLSRLLAAEQAREGQLPITELQHHGAHGLAVAAEHGLSMPLLAICWDGLGFGDTPAQRLWGGELLLLAPSETQRLGVEVRRLAALRPFPLIGGEQAMHEPRRAALSVLAAAADAWLAHPAAAPCREAFAPDQLVLLLQALNAGCHAPRTSSVGRLIDAAASLLGCCQILSTQAEGGMRLEGLAAQAFPDGPAYPLPLQPSDDPEAPLMGWLDWQPLLEALLADGAAAVPAAERAARVHRGLVQGFAAAAAQAAQRSRVDAVALGGGCFQNRLLLEGCIAALRRRALLPYWGQQVPCNDGGIAVGQLWATLANALITTTEPPARSHVSGHARPHRVDPAGSAAGRCS